MKVEGRVAIITGAGRKQGLGRYMAEAILNKGGKVCINDINREAAHETVHHLQQKYGHDSVFFAYGDVTSQSDMEVVFSETIGRWERVDILVNNAMMADLKGDWNSTIDIIMKGLVIGCNEALKHMSRDNGGDGGVIINIASMAGVAASFFVPVYSACKAGVIQYTSAMAAEPHYNKHRVRFNAVAPSLVDTHEREEIIRDSIHMTEEYKEGFRQAPTGKPGDVADAVLKLIENDSMNGELLRTMPWGVVRHSRMKTDYEQMAQLDFIRRHCGCCTCCWTCCLKSLVFCCFRCCRM